MTTTPSRTNLPVAQWFDPQEAMVDPYPQYERLREVGPVVYAPAVARVLVTTHEAVKEAEHHPEIFSSYSETNLTMMRAIGARPMLRKDDPEHATERQAINPTLRPRAIKNLWSPKFKETVEKWLDYLIEKGPADADINVDFAAPVASQNLIDLLGFPESVGVEDMSRWSIDFIAGTGNLLDDQEIWRRCDQSREEVDEILDDLLPRLRKQPDGSITSHLLEVGLPEESVRANAKLTISGGMNEPQHMISNMVWALSKHPQQRDLLLDGSAQWNHAFEETVRWQSPIGMIPREVAADTEFFGVHLEQGTNVGLLLASANRDSQAFVDPDTYDIRRAAGGHLGFGSGVHLCAGKLAAKNAIAEHALPRLYERLPNLELDPVRQPKWHGWVFRGLTTLPVTW
ncbi:cytochrome P450 [Yaniella halotolerans]|uniref:cytochrome P450 n=1 Tax=Yaniella halotolerans TaxID=225453 RepID=UPI0003B53A87|nr:cytochrome P450 [Yaniella halotolerans]